MWLIDTLAEARIQEAVEAGQFDDLAGAGRPQCLDDDVMVPEALRSGYRLLKNAGYLPPELQLRRDITEVEALLAQAVDATERAHLSRRLRYLMMQLSLARGQKANWALESAYADKLYSALTSDKG